MRCSCMENFNQHEMKTLTLDEMIEIAIKQNAQKRLALGLLRYEVSRSLDVGQYAELKRRSANGESFNQMIDELIIKNEK
jgi:hypothetical protein